MNKFTTGLELKKPVADIIAVTVRNKSNKGQQGEFFHELLAPPRTLNPGRHPEDQKGLGEFLPKPDDALDSFGKTETDIRNRECTGVNFAQPISTSSIVTNPLDEQNFTAGPVPSEYTLRPVTLNSSAMPDALACRPDKSTHKFSPEKQTQSSAKNTIFSANLEHGTLFQNPKLEISSQKSVSYSQTAKHSTSTVLKFSGSETIESPQNQFPFTSDNSADAKNLLVPAPNLVTSGGEFSVTGNMRSSLNSNVSGMQGISAYVDHDIRFATKSKSLLVQIDLPELGKITARFGGHADMISMTLISSDETTSVAVAEVQRDMQIWLDRANVDMLANAKLADNTAPLADMKPESSKEFQQETLNQGRRNNSHSSGASDGAPTFSGNASESIENQPEPDVTSSRKWRLI